MSNETDARIIEQFKPTLEMVSQLAQDDQESLLSSAYLALAAIIVLDPFPRNIFRGQKQAFDYDERAFNMAKLVIERGLDKLIPTNMRDNMLAIFILCLLTIKLHGYEIGSNHWRWFGVSLNN